MIHFVALSLFLISPDPSADSPPGPLQALESKLHGAWNGRGPCDGRLILNADGTFVRRHFSPGNNSLSGKWSVRWDALPPTLVLVCDMSDREHFIGKTTEVKILTLNDQDLIYQYPQETKTHYVRRKQ